MATFARVNGNTAGVVNVDAGQSFANAVIINTGIAAPLTAYKVTLTNGNLAAELGAPNADGKVGAVETLLKVVEGNATVLAYQVDTGNQLSVLTERSGWTDAGLTAAIAASNGGTTGNIGATGNVWVGGGVAAVSTGGIKLA